MLGKHWLMGNWPRTPELWTANPTRSANRLYQITEDAKTVCQLNNDTINFNCLEAIPECISSKHRWWSWGLNYIVSRYRLKILGWGKMSHIGSNYTHIWTSAQGKHPDYNRQDTNHEMPLAHFPVEWSTGHVQVWLASKFACAVSFKEIWF